MVDPEAGEREPVTKGMQYVCYWPGHQRLGVGGCQVIGVWGVPGIVLLHSTTEADKEKPCYVP